LCVCVRACVYVHVMCVCVGESTGTLTPDRGYFQETNKTRKTHVVYVYANDGKTC